MAEPDVVPALVALGFSLNESRAYAALLQDSPATGYEVGVRAQIPRSAVYGVLRRLVKAGAARSIAGTPERFAPAAAEDLLVLLRKRFESSTEQLEEAIRSIDTSPPAPDAFSVRGYQRILEEAERLIRGAQHVRARSSATGSRKRPSRSSGSIASSSSPTTSARSSARRRWAISTPRWSARRRPSPRS